MLGRTVAVSLIAFSVACSSSNSDPSPAASGGGGATGGVGGHAAGGSAGSGVNVGGTSSGGNQSVAGNAGSTSYGGGAGGSAGLGGGSAGLGGAGGSAQAGAGGSGGSTANPNAKQSLIWIWLDYKNSVDKVIQNAKSFTHVSPALYKMNYDYKSGVVQDVNDGGNYDGLTGKDMATKLHAAGLKIVPLMYAGAGNFGTDQGIQNILNDSGTAKNFMDAQIQEALDKGYDGWNLDWEVQGTNYDQYGQKLISFLTSFKAALHAHNMELSLDLGGWYVKQCAGNGLVDLKAIGPAVDQAIIEDYAGSFDGPTDKCPATLPDSQDCGSFGSQLEAMCNTTNSSVMIGLISPGSNSFAPSALDAISSYGFHSVAVWPDDAVFLKSDGIPNGGTWYSVLAKWLNK